MTEILRKLNQAYAILPPLSSTFYVLYHFQLSSFSTRTSIIKAIIPIRIPIIPKISQE